MMELHENIDEALLLLYFSGTLGEKEKEEVENWISLSEENRKIAKQICYIHHVTDIIDTVKQIDPKQALVKLDKRLSKRKKINWWEWGIRAAAVLFIPLFLFDTSGICFMCVAVCFVVLGCLSLAHLADKTGLSRFLAGKEFL